MSNDYVIVTDSTANLPEDMIEKYGLEILSLNYYVDGEEYKGYIKGQKTDLAHFYSMMRQKKEITTSLVTVGDAMDIFMWDFLRDLAELFRQYHLSRTHYRRNILIESFMQSIHWRRHSAKGFW